MHYSIQYRDLIEVNIDPQRRCYNGCHAKSELRWSSWVTIEIGVPTEKIESRLKFWQELNDYAISQRGQSARSEYEAIPEIG